MSTTVLIVDDYAPFRSFARSLLEAEGFAVVGEAGDGASALREFKRLQPDLVLLDIQLPDIDGFEVTRQLSRHGNAAIILTSSRDLSDYRRRLAASTARGFIPKSELSGTALGAILAGGP